MTKHLLVVLLAAVGCGTVTHSGSDDDGDQPDAGEPPVDPAVLSIVPTPWTDERNDAIDFTSGEPVHTHQGPTMTVGAGSGCPDAYRYAYLMDRAPAFGRQVTQNAIEIEVAVPTIALDEAASTYRLTTAAGVVVIPWTPIGAVPASGRVRIAIHRDEVAMLGTYDGELHFDARVRDTAGTEQLATACWVHHPMAAPLYVEAPQAALGPTSIMARQLATASAAIDVIVPTDVLPGMVSARFTQQTAEAITLAFSPSAPAGSFTSTIARVYVPTSTPTVPGNCEDFPDSCDQSPPPPLAPITASGSLTTGAYAWTLVDETASAKVLCPTGSCTIPPRAPGAAPRVYRVTIGGSSFTNLWGQAATPREITVAAGTVIGAWVTSNKVARCTRLRTINGVTACATLTEYTELMALDRATLSMSAGTVQVQTGIATTAPVPYLTGGAVTTPPLTWNGGDGLL